MDARKCRFAQTHLIRYAPKAQDTLSVLPDMAAFEDPLTLDIGYLSSLGSSFVIEIQAHIRTVVLKRESLGSLREEFLIPGRKFVPGRSWGGKAVDEKTCLCYYISLINV